MLDVLLSKDTALGASARNIKREFLRTAKLIRHRYFDNFIFIHIVKTGDTSIERALNLNWEHKTALEKIKQVGQSRWNSIFTFAFVRNPWDRVVSHFHFRKSKKNKIEQSTTFRDWVELTYGQEGQTIDYHHYLMPQSMWVADHDGIILVDFIGRFENLSEDFKYVCKQIGKNAALPYINATKHRHYRDYYDDRTIKIVERWFRKDIEMFGYKF